MHVEEPFSLSQRKATTLDGSLLHVSQFDMKIAIKY